MKRIFSKYILVGICFLTLQVVFGQNYLRKPVALDSLDQAIADVDNQLYFSVQNSLNTHQIKALKEKRRFMSRLRNVLPSMSVAQAADIVLPKENQNQLQYLVRYFKTSKLDEHDVVDLSQQLYIRQEILKVITHQ